MKGIIVFFCLMVGATVAAGDDPAGIVLTPDRTSYNLSPEVEYFEDATGSIPAGEILSGRYDGRFQRSEHNSMSFGFSKSSYWLKFKYRTEPEARRLHWYIVMAYPLIDTFELHEQKGDGSWSMRRTGIVHPISSREMEGHNFGFSLPPGDGEWKTVYLRFVNSGSMILDLSIFSERGLHRHEQMNTFFYGAIYGLLAVMLLYNFFLYLSLRDRAYLLYVFYVALFILMRLSLDGLFARYLWGDFSAVMKFTVPMVCLFTVGAACLFVRYIVEFHRYQRHLDLISKAWIILLFLSGLLTPLLDYMTMIRFSGINLGIGSIFILAIIIIAYRKGQKAAGYILLAWVVELAFALLYSLNSLGVISSIFVGLYGMHVGPALEMVLLSFALGYKVNIIKQEKEEAQRLAIDNLHRADRLKDEFLANTSHELRTPLNGIIGLAEALTDGAAGPLTEKARKSLDMISSSGRRLSNLVNDILDYSKLRHHEIELRRRPVDLKALVDAVMTLSRPLCAGKDLALVNGIEAGKAEVFADEDRVQQIMLNLMGNAIKFTQEGSVTVTAERKGPLVEVAVRDSGIGIPENARERIFESFEQVDGSVARMYGGTGLGLSLSRQLVELHGGTIGVISSEGRGSTFFFTLPAAEGMVAGESMAPAHDPGGPMAMTAEAYADDSSSAGPLPHAQDIVGVNGNGDRPMVHIVDDDPVNLQVLEDHLEMQNYRVVKSMNGPDALAQIAGGGQPDLMLLDVMMPRMSGYEVAAELRKTHSLFDLPIMMLTAKNRMDDMVAGFSSGANDYLPKPFNKPELLARVKTLVTLKSAVQERQRLVTIDREMEVAREILQTAIPEGVPVLSSIEVGVKYVPMERVGGDYYDFHIMDGRRMGVYISDVSGHGVGAAVIASMVKIAFSTVRRYADSPCELLEEMNHMLTGQMSGHFLTAAYLFLDVEARVLRYARAGHEPLLVHRRRTGQCMEYVPGGRAMTSLGMGKLEMLECPVEKGDRIILYTDGITEAMDRRRTMFGLDRFISLLKENAGMEAAKLADAVMERLLAWTERQNSLDDDLSLVIVDIH